MFRQDILRMECNFIRHLKCLNVIQLVWLANTRNLPSVCMEYLLITNNSMCLQLKYINFKIWIDQMFNLDLLYFLKFCIG